MTRREFILSSSALAVCGCRTSAASDALRMEMRRCVDSRLYSGLAVGSSRIAPLVAGSRTLDGRLPVTGFSSRTIAHSGWTGPVIAVDPERDFAGVVLGGQIAGKAKTMDARVDLLRAMT